MPEGSSSRNIREEIIEQAVSQFATHGYDGVSMRDVASAVGVSVAALYYHFSDKEQLYLEAIERVFEDKLDALKKVLCNSDPAWMRLEQYVAMVCQWHASDKNLLRLTQWMLLDSDEQRINKLVHNLFQDMINLVRGLAAELGKGYNPALLSISIIGMVYFPFICEKAHRYLAGYPDINEDTATLEHHIFRLLRNGLAGDTSARLLAGNYQGLE